VDVICQPEIYEKEHLTQFTVDELTHAYGVFLPIDQARAKAEQDYEHPQDAMLIGDTFAALAAVSDDSARRVAELLEEPIDLVLRLRDELLARLARRV
jgi:hypothetical protein